jgi:DNA repair protein RadC
MTPATARCPGLFTAGAHAGAANARSTWPLLHEVTMSDTPLRHRPVPELLAALLGDDAARCLAHLPLTELFGLSAPTHVVHEPHASPLCLARLDIAKELMCRALSEAMRQSDVFDTPDRIRDLLRLRYAGLPHEVFTVLLLNAQHHLIEVDELFRGTLTQTSVYPREIVKLALLRNAAAVVLAHNHPSGSGEPSRADEYLTRTLKDALALVDIKVLDHFIVGGTTRPTSMAERGLI